MRQTIKISGVFHCKIYKNGKLIKEYTDKNLVVNGGKDKLARSLNTGIIGTANTISLGTNSTAPLVTDTAITAPFSKSIFLASYITNGVELDWEILTSEGNGATYREFGLLLSDGTLFARKVGLTIAKNSTISITGKWTITIT